MAVGAGAGAVAEVEGLVDELAAGAKNHRAELQGTIRGSAACHEHLYLGDTLNVHSSIGLQLLLWPLWAARHHLPRLPLEQAAQCPGGHPVLRMRCTPESLNTGSESCPTFSACVACNPQHVAPSYCRSSHCNTTTLKDHPSAAADAIN